MDLSKAFPCKYLKARDLDQNDDTVYTIESATMEILGQGDDAEEKPVLWFRETELGLALNKTNVGRIYSAHNCTDSDELKGKRIALYVDHEVQFGLRTVSAIRVRARAPKGGKPKQQEEAGMVEGEEIPF